MAETQAITEFAARLEQALSPDCAQYNALLAKERPAQPSKIAIEAVRRTPCVPLSMTECDAAALAEQGRELHAAGKLTLAVVSYESSWKCKRDPQTTKRGFLVACNIPSVQKAKLFWKRLSAEMKPTVISSCENNKITRSELDAP